ncbi:translation initiation factor Sui1 [bacterium]|nr:translation initiation factor Sui1 [bacterium]
MPKNRIVYSTDHGRMCPECGHPKSRCACRGASAAPPADGVVRVRREVKGRAGKTVTAVYGLPLRGGPLEALASELKRKCSAGGSVKEGVVVIQGDHRGTVVPFLEARGYRVKQAGG